MVTRGASSLLLSGGGQLTVARTFEEYEDLVRSNYHIEARWSALCFENHACCCVLLIECPGHDSAHATFGPRQSKSKPEELPSAVQFISNTRRLGTELGGQWLLLFSSSRWLLLLYYDR